MVHLSRACAPVLLGWGLACTLVGGAWGADLTVSAAASLSNAFRALAASFEASQPGVKLVFNFAASDALLAQIARGAPVDVFAAADQDSMDRAAAQQRLAVGTRRNFASNRLVVVAPADSTLAMKALGDLAQPAVRRIAVGNPGGVPAGRYAQAALEAAGLWAALQPRTVNAQNVRQALDYVARGEADAGFVFATDAATQPGKVTVRFHVATPAPILYPAAALAASPQPAAAKAFVQFLAGPAAQAVLAQHGFGPPAAP